MFLKQRGMRGAWGGWRPLFWGYDMLEKSRSPLYKRAVWRKRRKAHLGKNPFCAYCLKFEQKLILGTICDHIEPWKTAREFFSGKVQTLCKRHHNEKTATEDRDYWERKKTLEIKDF